MHTIKYEQKRDGHYSLIFKFVFDKDEGATTSRMSMNHDVRKVNSSHAVDEACNWTPDNYLDLKICSSSETT